MQARPPATASMSARRALASKDIGTTASTLKTKDTADSDKPNVFSKVFTPVDKEEIKQPTEHSLQPESQSFRTTGQNAALKPGTQRRTLLGDAQTPFKVFSRPPEKDSVFSRPGSFSTSDEDASNVTPPPDSSNRASLGTFIPQRQEEIPEVLSSEDEEYQEHEDIPPNAAMNHDEDTEEFEATHEAPFGGRFGQFNVMTPITERTLEYTSTDRFSVPDGDTSTTVESGERAFGEPDAVEAAERLAAEVRENNVFSGKPRAVQFRHNPRRDEESSSSSFEESLFSRPPPFRLSEGHTIITPGKADEDSELRVVTALVEEKTGTLNLSDGIFTAPGFDLPNPCNPFDPQIISTLLSHLPTDPHCYHVPRESQFLENLQKFARKQMRKSRSLTRDQTFSLQLEDVHFQVYDKLGEGGFGAVFSAKAVAAKVEGNDDEDEDEDDEDEDEESRRVAIKVVKPSNSWEFQMLRKVHAGLPAPLRSSVIHPHALYTFHDESFLILDLCTQGSLLDIINRASSAGISQQGTCLDELLVMFFTIELLRLLEGLHKAGFIHGDLKIDNCLVRLEDVSPSSAWAAQYDPTGAGGWHSKGIKLIDFGRTIDIRMFPRGQTFVAEWATDARDCVEMREGRPWTYQADYFGLAGIVYCMLYGKYIEASSIVPVTPSPSPSQQQGNRSRYKLATAFKRYWQTDLWTRLFDVLLNPCLVNPDGALAVSDTLAQLRAEMETWLQANCSRSSNTLKGLLKKIELSVIRGD
jgi:checkpoint serine/threonine-protein kinase